MSKVSDMQDSLKVAADSEGFAVSQMHWDAVKESCAGALQGIKVADALLAEAGFDDDSSVRNMLSIAMSMLKEA